MRADSLPGRVIAALARTPEAKEAPVRSRGVSPESAMGRILAAIARTEPAEVPTPQALLIIVMADKPAAASPTLVRYRPAPPERLTAAARLNISAAPSSA